MDFSVEALGAVSSTPGHEVQCHRCRGAQGSCWWPGLLAAGPPCPFPARRGGRLRWLGGEAGHKPSLWKVLLPTQLLRARSWQRVAEKPEENSPVDCERWGCCSQAGATGREFGKWGKVQRSPPARGCALGRASCRPAACSPLPRAASPLFLLNFSY